jgi:hypothetical protein
MPRLKQAVSWWCFAQGELLPQTLVRTAADIGYEGIELVDQDERNEGRYPCIAIR